MFLEKKKLFPCVCVVVGVGTLENIFLCIRQRSWQKCETGNVKLDNGKILNYEI